MKSGFKNTVFLLKKWTPDRARGDGAEKGLKSMVAGVANGFHS